MGRDLMFKDEIERLDNDLSLVKIRAAYPWKDQKYVLEKHPNYNYLYEPNNKKARYLEPFDFIAYRDAYRQTMTAGEAAQELQASDDPALVDGMNSSIEREILKLNRKGFGIDIDMMERAEGNKSNQFGDKAHDKLLRAIERGTYVTPDMKTDTGSGRKEEL